VYSKTLILHLLILISNVFSSAVDLKVYDTLAFNKMIYLKIAAFDTIPEFINYHNKTSQKKYAQLFCTMLKNELNEHTSFEILDSDSKIEPTVTLHILFKDLYTDSPKIKRRRYCYTSCTIEIIGKKFKDNTPVFSITSKRKTIVDDLKDELRDNIIEIANDIYDEFDDLRDIKIKKSFQYYDFDCKNLSDIHFTFIEVPNTEAIKLLYDVADATIQHKSFILEYPIKRLYLKEIDSIITKKRNYSGSLTSISCGLI